mgnify:FL=1
MNFYTEELKIINVDGGNVLHGLRSSDKNFKGFGELYFSWIKPKKVKAWKKHKLMTMNLIVPHGLVKFVIFNEKKPDKFHEVILGNSLEEMNYYKRLTIEPNLWFGFQGMGNMMSLVVNLADIEHDPNEAEKSELSDINYSW